MKEQILTYNELAIQSLSKMLGGGGQIILFINKTDLIYPWTDERMAEARGKLCSPD